MSNMTVNDYQADALRFAGEPPDDAFISRALKLAGEAGEFCDKLGKHYRGDYHEFPREALVLELGDVMWYVAALAHQLGYSLEEVAEINIRKLTDRQMRNVLQGDGDNR